MGGILVPHVFVSRSALRPCACQAFECLCRELQLSVAVLQSTGAGDGRPATEDGDAPKAGDEDDEAAEGPSGARARDAARHRENCAKLLSLLGIVLQQPTPQLLECVCHTPLLGLLFTFVSLPRLNRCVPRAHPLVRGGCSTLGQGAPSLPNRNTKQAHTQNEKSKANPPMIPPAPQSKAELYTRTEAKCQAPAPKAMLPAGGTLPKWGHRHGGIMRPVPLLLQFSEPAPFTPNAVGGQPPPPPIHCGEHLPAWGLRDDCIPGTDQAVRGERHGQKLHSGFPPRKVDARGSADARSSTDACLS